VGQVNTNEKGVSIMLVLSRNKQESVVVGDTNCFECIIKITVLEIIGGKVKLGFEADEGVPVHRWEVWERICASGRQEVLV
jgi:carbon storage regulator CsrA